MLGPIISEELPDQVLSPTGTGQCARYANLPPVPDGLQAMEVEEIQDYVQREHNCCLVTITNRLYYLLVACKDIPAGTPIWAHYGPASHITLTRAQERANRF